jgi:hypothetical protein
MLSLAVKMRAKVIRVAHSSQALAVVAMLRSLGLRVGATDALTVDILASTQTFLSLVALVTSSVQISTINTHHVDQPVEAAGHQRRLVSKAWL